MNPFRTIGPAFRRLGVILLITLLVFLCLSLYYFKYIPANRDRLERQGFLMLKQHSDGINYTLTDLRETFCQWRKRFVSEKWYQDSGRFSYEKPFQFSVSRKNGKGNADTTNEDCQASIHFDVDDKNEISFLFAGYKDTLTYNVELDNVFDRTLESGSPDFFQSYMVLCQHKAAHILYSSPGLPVIHSLQDDTLTNTLKSIQFSKIVSLDIAGNTHKAFLQPVTIENKSLLLVGLLNEGDYNRRLQNIPFSTVSMVIIIFILILILLPYVKIFMISSQEHMGIRDIAFVGTSMLIGTAVLLAIFHHLIMQTGGLIRTKDELYTLGGNISESIHKEINKAYNELTWFDDSLAKRTASNIGSDGPGGYNTLSVKKNSAGSDTFYTIQFPAKPFYSNYSIVHWADKKGQQLYKGRLDENAISFVNIYNRNYFTNVREKKLFSFTRPYQAEKFTVEPVYSRTTNTFEVNVAKPSKVDSCTMAALSTHLGSVMNTVLPAGYGFYVIDNSGLIYFQSQGNVTLRENFLEWINDDQTLAKTLMTRQSRYIPNQFINNKQFSQLVMPLANLPWHLVVFHCNEHTTASILRVDAFTLFFLLILYAVLFLFSLIIWSQTSYFTRLTQSVYQYDWIRPGENKLEFLTVANKYLIVYTILATGYAFLARKHATALFIGLVAPLFTLWILYVLFWYRYLHKQNFHKHECPDKYVARMKPVFNVIVDSFTHRFNIIPMLFIVLMNVVYYTLERDLTAEILAAVFQFISLVILFMALSGSLINKPKSKGDVSKAPGADDRNLSVLRYYKFWALTAGAISLAPAFCFFQYAQNREIASQIKSRQLYLAQQTEARLDKFGWLEQILKKRSLDEKRKDSILFHEGIYLVNEGDAIEINKPVDSLRSMDVKTNLYDTLMNHISWDYRALDKWMPIQNRALDDQWRRYDFYDSTKKMGLNYAIAQSRPGSVSNASSIFVSSEVPGIFSFYHISRFGMILLLIFSGMVGLFFYYLLKRMISKLFQVNYFDQEPTGGWQSMNIVKKKSENPYIAGDIKKTLDNYEACFGEKLNSLDELWCKEFEYNRTSEAQLNKLENVILYNQQQLHYLYEEIWKKCDDKEKYFLYDMARDGFTNYKKSQLIQMLLYKGYLRRKEGNLVIMSMSFRNFITLKKGDSEIAKLKDEHQSKGTWSSIRTPVLVGIAAIGIFLFITQDGLFQRIGALIPTLSSILGLGSTLIGKSGGK